MRSYAICATPRTGSTYLCTLLREAGLGDPDEWLHAGRARSWTTIKQLRAQRRTNGIFAIKLFWVHREDGAIVDFDDVLPAGGKWIFLRRKDTLSQARSYLTALSREEWADVGVPYEKFSRELELRTEARMRRRNEDWNRWFRRKGIRPLRLTYEEIVADPARAVDSVRALLYHRPVGPPHASHDSPSSGVASLRSNPIGPNAPACEPSGQGGASGHPTS